MLWSCQHQYTIRNLECVVPAGRILYLFYENMTSHVTGPDEIRRIETALGLAPADIDLKLFRTTVNRSPSIQLDPDNVAAATELFSHVYRFVQQRFGEASGWKYPVAARGRTRSSG